MHDRSRIATGMRIPSMPERSTPGVHRSGGPGGLAYHRIVIYLPSERGTGISLPRFFLSHLFGWRGNSILENDFSYDLSLWSMSGTYMVGGSRTVPDIRTRDNPRVHS